MKTLLLSLLLVAMSIAMTTQKSLAGNAVRQYCHWRCADEGEALVCATDEAMAGLCGSDNRDRCESATYCPDRDAASHALLCCTYQIILEDTESEE